MTQNHAFDALDKTFLGTQPIPALLARLSVPAMIGMLVNSLYNLVDTIFVGQGVGPLAIAALGIAFPVQMLIAGFAQMFGVGAASIVSRKLGEGDDAMAAKAAGGAFLLTIATACLLTCLGLLFLDTVLVTFGATEDILPYAEEYLGIILLGAVSISISMCSNNLLRSEGKARASMTVMLIGTGLNLVLDPLFIFAFGLGIRGAAIATVISQVSSAVFAISLFVRRKTMVRIRIHDFFVSLRLASEMMILGFPTFIRQAGTSAMALAVNNMLGIYGGDMAIAAYGMISKLMVFFLMPVFGIVQGFQPIAGFNYGAKNYKRVLHILKLGVGITSGMGILSSVLIQLFPRLFLGMFTSDHLLISLASPALRIVMLGLPFVGIQTIGTTLFQSIGKSVPALVFGLSRQFIMLIPLVLLLPQIMGLSGVWWAFPIADSCATLLTGIWLLHEISHLRIRGIQLRDEER